MSEDFLSRWSRRKRQAEIEGDNAQADEQRQAVREASAEETGPAEPAAPAESTLDLLKDLPPIESITAATDIRPFLAPGVPVDIARAALRRAWAADPQIRDFVGLADYDWDFNAPGAMAGFGTLEMTEELRAAVFRLLGQSTERGQEPEREPAVDRTVGARAEERADINKTPPVTSAADPAESRRLQHARNTFVLPASPYVAARHETNRHQETTSSQTTSAMVRRSHGRALPK